MSNFNKVILMGRLTATPELRYTPGRTAVTDVSLAINRKYRAGGEGGELKDEVTFVDVTYWGKQAETLCQYLRKGAPLHVEGRLSLDQWEDSDGKNRQKLKVTGESFQFLGSSGNENREAADATAQEAATAGV